MGDHSADTARSRTDLGLNLASPGQHTAEARTLVTDGLTTLAAAAGEEGAAVKEARAVLVNFAPR